MKANLTFLSRIHDSPTEPIIMKLLHVKHVVTGIEKIRISTFLPKENWGQNTETKLNLHLLS